MAKGFGFAHPLPSLPLLSVLYALECPFNLISISKITRTLNCFITFSDKFVTLQDRSTGKTIGIGRESQGLYYLIAPSTLAVCISTDAPFLIHSRLGHPNLSKFQKMVPSFSFLSSLACESCQLGKHTRVSFPKRLNNRAKSPFELSTLMFGVLVGLRQTFCQSHKMHLLGIFQTSKGYRCYSSETHRYFLSADVTFLRTPLPSRPLQVYHRRHRVAVPPSLAKVLADSLPIPSASPAPTLPPFADLPIALRKVGCRWVYTVKVGPDGQVDRLKARLVAKGYTQVYGSDYGDTFFPVAKIASGESGLVCRLRRSLYGLKQSPRAWFNRFSSIVQEFGMFRSTVDHSVFYHHNSLGQCIYLTKDLGKLKYFLGIEITQSSSGVVLSQRKYALDILEETGMLDCKPVDTPMDPNVKLIPGQGEPLGVPGRYRRLVGKLNYLTITRPDISFPHTRPRCVVREQRSYQVVGYTDADWAGSPTDRRSTSGYCVFIGGNLISWKSKKQDVVARSSVEAEYRAMALATCELIWLKHLLRELRFGKDEQMKLICDNQAALHIASNPVFHERTKYIEVDCHFIREKIASGCVAISFVNSNDQLADIFTKSLRGHLTPLLPLFFSIKISLEMRKRSDTPLLILCFAFLCLFVTAIGEAYNGDISFADSLEAFGGGQDDPISVSIGGPVLSKFITAFVSLLHIRSFFVPKPRNKERAKDLLKPKTCNLAGIEESDINKKKLVPRCSSSFLWLRGESNSILGNDTSSSWDLIFCRNLPDVEIEDLERLMSLLSNVHLTPSTPDAKAWVPSSSGEPPIRLWLSLGGAVRQLIISSYIVRSLWHCGIGSSHRWDGVGSAR
ncbi:Retrovirus-related Pol polyprotein from transposon RE1 [Vitis vinifera]|uniref:Retrovirus-related Pol polyprotein from transposon RE1 n=1 Tax=Vitis vinifera TaxID=29760 RepID=A0A438EJH9_VITVI|nr:Retrovirus-related Pol polyprotein from transposon RE1 [Vitis vinifera]